MALTRLPIADATPEQLRTFAETVLQLTVPARATQQSILGKIGEVWTQDTILIDDAASGEPVGAQRSGNMVNVRPRVDKDDKPVMTTNDKGEPVQEEEVHVLIHVSDKPGGDEPVFVSINGRGMYVPRGEKCWVPRKFIGALIDAVELHYPEYTGGDGGLEKPREVPSYPFSFV